MGEQARNELKSIIDGLSAKDREFISVLPEGDIIRLHRTLGRYIRNQFRSNELPALVRWSLAQLPEHPHFDDLSWPVLVKIWKALRPQG